MKVLVSACLISLVATACSSGAATKPEGKTPVDDASAREAAALKARIAQFAPVELTADISQLPPSERLALAKIIEASRLLDPVFDRQAWAGNAELERRLAADRSALGRAKLDYFRIMRGPWDRQAEHEPFAVEQPAPAGAGFYPEEMTAEEFRAYVAAHPAQKEALESLFTMVNREGDRLVAVPYSVAFAPYLEPAADLLREAAKLTTNKSLRRFLELRAAAFASDDYYVSDKAWMDVDSTVEVTIGPYETYEDRLLGLKASFESFVTVADPKASEALARYKAMLPEMEQNLPIPDEMKTKRGAESPIRVVDVVYTSGDARKSVQTIAFNLPNDERVRKEKGAKKVLLRNLIETKFDVILRPIAGRILAEEQLADLSADAFFHQTLFHELSHSLGPAFSLVDGKEREVREVLGAFASPLEEAKADVMGAYNLLYMVKRGEKDEAFRRQLLTSYFAGLFRSVRFGVSEAHGQGAALQINWYLKSGAVQFSQDSGRFRVDLDGLTTAIAALVREICILQRNGDAAGVEKLLGELGVVSEPMKLALGKFEGIPVDIRPVYPLAGKGDN